jgi:predicted O-linked N-acetylglucosamine transferase (SPINDLY family)
LPARGFVFCCFNHAFKILPSVYDVWMRLLTAVDGSVLWLLDSNAAATRNLQRQAATRGVAPERLAFAPRVPLDAHLARHRHADLVLDTMPYNAHTTASDALWAGVPVVTCLGDTFAGRVAASLVRAVGLSELVAADLAAYEALALALARDPSRLAALRAMLAANRTTAPLFDTRRFACDLEALYAAMIARLRAGAPPDHLLPGTA